MIRPSYLLLYDEILVDHEAVSLLQWEEKVKLIRERCSKYFESDPYSMVSAFVDKLKSNGMLKEIDIHDGVTRDDERLLELLAQVDLKDKKLLGKDQLPWLIDRANFMLLASLIRKRPFYDSFLLDNLYLRKLSNPSLSLALHIRDSKPDLLREPNELSDALRNIDRESRKAPRRFRPSTSWRGLEGGYDRVTVRLPLSRISKMRDIDVAVSDIMNRRDSDEELKNAREFLGKQSQSWLSGWKTEAQEEVESLKGELRKLNREARKDKRVGNWVTLGTSVLTIIIALTPGLGPLAAVPAGAAIGSALASEIREQKSGWLFYLHESGVF